MQPPRSIRPLNLNRIPAKNDYKQPYQQQLSLGQQQNCPKQLRIDSFHKPQTDFHLENGLNKHADLQPPHFALSPRIPKAPAAAPLNQPKDIQESLSQLAQLGVHLIRDMEGMINTYRLAVECAVSKETKLKNSLHQQWEAARTDAQKLLDSVKESVSTDII
ncbi:hypothetical protein BX661DRAFT_168690 [Kickxella alabastrina]|uniref:uncharacterized protein n=1 Tax=Kickxella alabastrina TaxID=61397 RepID=UPI00221ED063|nr:uncharacterized protein BX661DRAFT_168690 [Kickxella alabastrina]KAI7834329.1 hypothetical protein BX661DRAFT_168690 [Kickxella alabastrina]